MRTEPCHEKTNTVVCEQVRHKHRKWLEAGSILVMFQVHEFYDLHVHLFFYFIIFKMEFANFK